MAAQPKLSTQWYWSLLPISAASAGLGTLVPLLVLEVGGSVVDVGLAASAFNVALIPGALIWGRIIDHVGRRRPFLVFPFLGQTLILPLFALVKEPAQIFGLFALFAFVGVAASPAINLLLMETAPKAAWSAMFARNSSIFQVGQMLGVLPGVVWTAYFPLRSYSLLATVFALPSVLLAWQWVPEPPITLERGTIVRQRDSFIHRLTQAPLLFLRIPHPADFKAMYRALQTRVTQEVPVLFITVFLFFVSASLFFTAYTPFLKQRGVRDGEVFLANFALLATNAIMFPMAGRLSRRMRDERLALNAYALRSTGTLLGVILAVVATGLALLAGTFIVFILMGTAFAFTNTGLNALVFRSLKQGRHGELMGVYSALTGLALFLGAYGSGVLAERFDYIVTFSVAYAALVGSFLMLVRFTRLPGHLA